MSCLLPHFNCHPDTFTRTTTPIRHHLILQPPAAAAAAATTKTRHFRPQCVLSPSTSSTALLDLDNKFDAWPYVAAQATSSAESLLTSEEAVITAAASEALALARAAAKLAKDAALLVKNKPPQQPQLPTTSENLLLKWVQHMEEAEDAAAAAAAGPEIMEYIEISPAQEEEEEEFDDEEPTSEELQDAEKQLSDSIDARSGRQLDRKARRVRATGKAATNVMSFKFGSTRRKKRRTHEVNSYDPLRHLRAATRSSRVLTASEEVKLSEGVQDLIKLKKLQEELAEKYGGEPTFAEWATKAGVDEKTLRKRLNYGAFCKEKMMKSNIRLVISVAKNYQGSGMSLQDMVQEGCRGLVRGVEKFDASKGFKFSTYAHWWIKQAIRRALSVQTRLIRLPSYMVGAAYKVKQAKKRLYSVNGKQPDDKEVAEAAGMSMKRLRAVLLTPKTPKSLETKIGINQSLKPSEVLADPEAVTTEDRLIKQFLKKDLEKVLDSLNPREQQVIRWRFGMDDGRTKTLQEIGEMIGVSRERIRQIEACAFRKLRNKKRAKHLQQYVAS